MTKALACTQPGCNGAIAADGYCDTCGAKAPARKAAAPKAKGKAAAAGAALAASAPVASATFASRGSLVSGSARSGGSRRSAFAHASTRTTSARTSGIGAGLVDLPTAPPVDPASIVMRDGVVAEEKRFCSSCGAPVGRARPDAPHGRVAGVCSKCRHHFDFEAKLKAGKLIGGQYEVVGPLAHGGLGWLYLARDKAVNDRWVVLKGLLDAGDEGAMRAAVAERQFLALLSHPNIVGILNFVTERGAGYIVEEFVGGKSLKQMLVERRAANGGVVDPMPVDQALAYILAVLPAFAYLHERGLVYCDFKPDNLLQVADQVKLIDLGAVRRIDDQVSDVYGTVGFQAPEVPDVGPSVASDLYTIGRTLAVLTLDFRGYQKQFVAELPDPTEHAALTRFDSFYRLLLKLTAPHPDDRFQSVGELTEQLIGVLREVVAVSTGKPQFAPSTVFGPASDDATLPSLVVDPSDPAAGFLANLSPEPERAVVEIRSAIDAGTIDATVEARLREAAALAASGEAAAATDVLASVEGDDPWEWRVSWLRGAIALEAGDLAAAAAAFDRCRSEVPGELAPKFAAGLVAERQGDFTTAAALYDTVATTDPSFVSAARGLGRSLAATGNVDRALVAFERVPITHRAYGDAQADAVRMLVGAGRFADAGAKLTTVRGLDDRARAAVEVELYESALRAATQPGASAAGVPIGGYASDPRGLRRGLEHALRRRANMAPDREERIALIDRANRERPLTIL